MKKAEIKYWLIFGPLCSIFVILILYLSLGGIELDEDIQGIVRVVFKDVILLFLIYAIGPFMLKIVLKKAEKWDIFTDWFNKKSFSRIIYLASLLIFGIPLIIITITYLIIFTWYEAIYPFLGLLFFAGLYIPPLLNKDERRTVYKNFVSTFSTLIFMFFGFLNWIWTFMGFLHALNVLISLENTSKAKESRSEQELKRESFNLKYIIQRVGVGIIIFGLVLSPIFAILFEGVGLGYMELPQGNEPDNFHIDWTWEFEGPSPRTMTPEILDAIQTCNELDHVNVSITVNLPMDYVHGTLNQTVVDHVQALLDRNIRVSIMPFNPHYPNHFYVNDFTVVEFNQTYQDFKEWMHNCGFDGKITALIVDLEPIIYNISLIIDSVNRRNQHQFAVNYLTQLLEQMKEEMHPLGTSVIGAAFGFAAVDVLDLDDSVFRVLSTLTYPPTNWDGLGFMNYFFQIGSDYATYSSCKMLDYYYGKYAIPYITSTQNYENILNQFKIIRNLGINLTGIWALHQFLNHIDLSKFIELHQELNNPSDVVFRIEGAFIPTLYSAISLLDLLVFDPIIFPIGSHKPGMDFTYIHN